MHSQKEHALRRWFHLQGQPVRLPVADLLFHVTGQPCHLHVAAIAGAIHPWGVDRFAGANLNHPGNPGGCHV